MHISDGVLSPYVIIAGWSIAIPALALSVRKSKAEHVGAYGVIAAAFFAGSTIHIPIGPFNVHLMLNGIAGLLLGWNALAIISVGLVLQALFLGFGGITVLGVNITVIALPGAAMGVLGRYWLKRSTGKMCLWIGALTGGGAIFLSAVLLFTALSTTHPGLIPLSKLVFFGHIPVMLIEGFISFWLILFLQKTKPSLLGL